MYVCKIEDKAKSYFSDLDIKVNMRSMELPELSSTMYWVYCYLPRDVIVSKDDIKVKIEQAEECFIIYDCYTPDIIDKKVREACLSLRERILKAKKDILDEGFDWSLIVQQINKWIGTLDDVIDRLFNGE